MDAHNAFISLATMVAAGLYLFLPSYLANMSPVVASKVAGNWNRPLWESRLGKNKTAVGTLAGIISAMLITGMQYALHVSHPAIPQALGLDQIYDRVPWPLLGLVLGAGALGGDAYKSFLKRRRGIIAGARWNVWDNIDHGLGTFVVLLPLILMSQSKVALILTALCGASLGALLNRPINWLSHRGGIKNVPY